MSTLEQHTNRLRAASIQHHAERAEIAEAEATAPADHPVIETMREDHAEAIERRRLLIKDALDAKTPERHAQIGSGSGLRDGLQSGLEGAGVAIVILAAESTHVVRRGRQLVGQIAQTALGSVERRLLRVRPGYDTSISEPTPVRELVPPASQNVVTPLRTRIPR